MNGFIDAGGRALITVEICATPADKTREIEAWIDTGFTGDLLLPQNAIDELSLQQSGTVQAVLADGSQIVLIRGYDAG